MIRLEKVLVPNAKALFTKIHYTTDYRSSPIAQAERLWTHASIPFVPHIAIQLISMLCLYPMSKFIIPFHPSRSPLTTIPINSQTGTRIVKLALFSSDPSHNSDHHHSRIFINSSQSIRFAESTS